MDVAGHLTAALDAALFLANHFGAEHRQGRVREPDTAATRTAAVAAALRLFTRQDPPTDEASLDALATGSTHLYAALAHLTTGEQDSGARILNDVLREARAEPWLVRHDAQPWHLHFASPEADGARRWLPDLATSVAMLFGSTDADRLHRCEAERCDVLFLDATRNGTQRFCATACQNRTKVAAFRARRAG